MAILRNYTNTLLDLRSCEQRYLYLREKREVYYVRYLGAKSPNFEGLGVQKNWGVDGMSVFLDLVTKKNGRTGLSLDDEIEKLLTEMATLSKVLADMGKNLRRMKGIEYQLYSAVVIDNLNISRAVQKVAEDNFMSEQNIWATYYPRIKEELKRLEI